MKLKTIPVTMMIIGKTNVRPTEKISPDLHNAGPTGRTSFPQIFWNRTSITDPNEKQMFAMVPYTKIGIRMSRERPSAPNGLVSSESMVTVTRPEAPTIVL